MADWYYAKDGQQFGPISSQQLKQLAASGGLVPEDLVFREGSKDWVAASTVQGLFPTGGAKAPAAKPRAAGGGDFGFDESAATPERSAERPVRQPRESAAEAEPAASGSFGDLLMFRRMIAPWVVIVLFWLGVLAAVITGGGVIITGVVSLSVNGLMGILLILGGLMLIPIGILYVRLLSEIAIVLFRIHETLSDMRDLLQRQGSK